MQKNYDPGKVLLGEKLKERGFKKKKRTLQKRIFLDKNPKNRFGPFILQYIPLKYSHIFLRHAVLLYFRSDNMVMSSFPIYQNI